MISYQEAQDKISAAVGTCWLGTERVSLSHSAGRVCAEDIFAPINVQPFDNSAMDGFAVRRCDLMHAVKDHPVRLKMVGMIAAGDAALSDALAEGCCVQIMTGAPVPVGADAIVPIEQVFVQETGHVDFFTAPDLGAHIRRAGEDFKKGQILISVGQYLNGAHILPLATLGVGDVQVFKRPHIVFLSTGKELVDDLGATLQFGQIYNSNGFYATHFLQELGAECCEFLTIQDDLDVFIKVLSEMSDGQGNVPDIIVSSGAVSAGQFDFVRKGLEQMGAEILYHKIKIKPGKPNLLARLPNGTLYFGLPGNPVATAVGLRFFVHKAIQQMNGGRGEKPIKAILVHDFSKKIGLHMFLKAKTHVTENGMVEVRILEGQDSFMVHPFLEMTGWVSVAEEVGEICAGDRVDVYPFYPRGGLLV